MTPTRYTVECRLQRGPVDLRKILDDALDCLFEFWLTLGRFNSVRLYVLGMGGRITVDLPSFLSFEVALPLGAGVRFMAEIPSSFSFVAALPPLRFTLDAHRTIGQEIERL